MLPPVVRCIKVKVHQNRFRLGLRPRLQWGSLRHFPRLLAGFKGPASRGGRGGEEKEREGRRKEGSEGNERRSEGRGEGRERKEGRGPT